MKIPSADRSVFLGRDLHRVIRWGEGRLKKLQCVNKLLSYSQPVITIEQVKTKILAFSLGIFSAKRPPSFQESVGCLKKLKYVNKLLGYTQSVVTTEREKNEDSLGRSLDIFWTGPSLSFRGGRGTSKEVTMR